MAEQSSEHNETTEAEGGFPYVAVIISAIVLLALGTFMLNLAIGGSLPTGLGIGDALPANMVGGVDLDLIRGVIVVVVLAVIAVGSYMALRNKNS